MQRVGPYHKGRVQGVDQRRAARWAGELLTAGEFVVLDSETTGLGDPVGFVEVAVADPEGNAVVDTTVRPSLPIDPGAARVHGYTQKSLADSPTFREIYPDILDAIRGRRVIVYNARYDRRVFDTEVRALGARGLARGRIPSGLGVCAGLVFAIRRPERKTGRLQKPEAPRRRSLRAGRLLGHPGGVEEDGGGTMSAPEEVRQLIERFARNREQYMSARFNETQARVEFIDPLMEALGWDLHNRRGHAEPYREVIHEDRIKIGGGTKAPDYGFYLLRRGGRRKARADGGAGGADALVARAACGGEDQPREERDRPANRRHRPADRQARL